MSAYPPAPLHLAIPQGRIPFPESIRVKLPRKSWDCFHGVTPPCIIITATTSTTTPRAPPRIHPLLRRREFGLGTVVDRSRGIWGTAGWDNPIDAVPGFACGHPRVGPAWSAMTH